MLLDTSQLPRDRGRIWNRESLARVEGPGDRQSTFQRAQQPHLAGPRPSAAAAGEKGPGGGGRTRVWETRHAPKLERTNSGTQRAGPGRDSAGIEARSRRSSGECAQRAGQFSPAN